MNLKNHLLSFDCAGDFFSIGLFAIEQGSSLSIRLIENYVADRPHQHSEDLVAVAREILTRNQLSFNNLKFAACTTGPGSFTGIRVALSFAKMLKIALKIPVFGFNCCEVIAYQINHELFKNIDLSQLKSLDFDKETSSKPDFPSKFLGGQVCEKDGFLEVSKILIALPSLGDEFFVALYQASSLEIAGARGKIEEIKSPFLAKIDDVSEILDEKVLVCGKPELQNLLKTTEKFEPERFIDLRRIVQSMAIQTANLAIFKANLGEEPAYENLSAFYLKLPNITKRKTI